MTGGPADGPDGCDVVTTGIVGLRAKTVLDVVAVLGFFVGTGTTVGVGTVFVATASGLGAGATTFDGADGTGFVATAVGLGAGATTFGGADGKDTGATKTTGGADDAIAPAVLGASPTADAMSAVTC